MEKEKRGYVIRGYFSVTTLDDVLREDTFVQSSPPSRFDFVKTDVEGFEGMVMMGGKSLLQTYRAMHIQSEVWDEMKGLQSLYEYLQIFTDKGYYMEKDLQK